MRVLIIRHAIAVPRGTPGIPDDERPLTPEGERKFTRAARGLARFQKRPDVLLTSPLPRARRTAEIAAEAWGGITPTTEQALVSADFTGLAKVLRGRGKDATIALVGHEPGLSALLARLLGAKDPDRLTFKKGGAALVEVPGALEGGGSLVFFLPPKILRELGD